MFLSIASSPINDLEAGEFGHIIYRLNKNNTLYSVLDKLLSWRHLTSENICEGVTALLEFKTQTIYYIKKLPIQNQQNILQVALLAKMFNGDSLSKYTDICSEFNIDITELQLTYQGL